MKPFDWFLSYMKEYRVKFCVALFFSVVAIGFTMMNPYLAGQIAKRVFEENDRDALLPILGLMVIFTLIKSVIRYNCLMTYEKVSQNVAQKIRLDVYTRMQAQSFKFFDENSVGDIMARLTGDLDAIRHFVANVIYSLFENVLYFVISMIFMLMISWELTLAMLLVAPLIAWCSVKQAKEIKPHFSNIREQFSKLNQVCTENISGNRVIKAFTREDFEVEKFTKQNQGYYDANYNASKVWVKYVPKQEFYANLMLLSLILVGGILVAVDRISVSQLITANGYLWAMTMPMRMMGWLMNDVQRFFASMEKIHTIVRFKINIKNKENAVVPREKLKGTVEFKNVSFSYADVNSSLVLKNISFKAEAGQTIGIVGPTGSGKSSLVGLISRFYDVTKGSVMIDGVDVRDYNLRAYRKHIAYAMQDVFLYSDTIEGNLSYGVPEAEMDILLEATHVANAHTFITETEDGYDTIVGERGVGLSGGQKQRVSLARAIAINPSILILDDTTSAVDMETEHEIQSALKDKYSDKTTFIIAHRISSVKPADKILVVVDGEIIEEGNHDELVEKQGYYYSLYMEQYGDILKMKGVVA